MTFMKKSERKEVKLKESKKIAKLVDEAYDEWRFDLRNNGWRQRRNI